MLIFMGLRPHFGRFLASKPRFWPPQTLPKSTPNAFKIKVPKTMQFFMHFCVPVGMFCKYAHVLSDPLKLVFRRHRTISFASLLAYVLLPKTYVKPFQNEVPTFPKSIPKKYCFSISIFFNFGLDFGGS